MNMREGGPFILCLTWTPAVERLPSIHLVVPCKNAGVVMKHNLRPYTARTMFPPVLFSQIPSQMSVAQEASLFREANPFVNAYVNCKPFKCLNCCALATFPMQHPSARMTLLKRPGSKSFLRRSDAHHICVQVRVSCIDLKGAVWVFCNAHTVVSNLSQVRFGTWWCVDVTIAFTVAGNHVLHALRKKDTTYCWITTASSLKTIALFAIASVG